MTTIQESIDEARNYLLTTYRPQFNLLSADITSSQNTLVVTDELGGIQPGARLSIDLELMYVRSVTGQTATVIRGRDGSTGAAHLTGALITVNPIFPDFTVYQAITRDLLDLQSSGLFAVEAYELTFNAARYEYDLPITNLREILEIRYRTPSSDQTWPQVRSFSWHKSTNLTSFPSGQSLRMDMPGFPGQPIRVVAAVDFTQPTSLVDDLADDCGLPASAEDLPAMGAAIRMAAGREIARNFQESQGQPRRSDEVPPGANLGATRELKLLRLDRINTEAGALRRQYPRRSSRIA